VPPTLSGNGGTLLRAALGRGLGATIEKAHELRISLKMMPKRGSRPPIADSGAARFDLPSN
jgi:hypothetical protein